MGQGNHSEKTVADYIAQFIQLLGISNVHGLTGGGASGLNDAFIRNNHLSYLCYHHEQSAGYAALGEARKTGRWAIVNPTTGCGGTNCITPVLNAFQDSIPLVIISGNVPTNTLSSKINESLPQPIRSYGVQEHDIITTVRSITKFTELLDMRTNIGEALYECFEKAIDNRRGPVWIDVPSDIQHLLIDASEFDCIHDHTSQLLAKLKSRNSFHNQKKFNRLNVAIEKSQRPLLLIGGGGTSNPILRQRINEFILSKDIPVVATYAGTNVVDHSYNYYLGCVGIKGNRTANFAVQNADLLIVLGSRLGFASVGYEVEKFAKNAKIFILDVDPAELDKNKLLFGDRAENILGDISSFLDSKPGEFEAMTDDWRYKCKYIKENWSDIENNLSHYKYEGISIYNVISELNKNRYDDCNFVIDAGSISYVGPTCLKFNSSRSFIFSPAQADMGCALPSSLGVAACSQRKTICITGDGSFMSNLQELATLSYHRYDVVVILLNNNGYLSITNTQKNNYSPNNIFGEHEGRGLKFPYYEKVCLAFDIPYQRIDNVEDLSNIDLAGPRVIDVNCVSSEEIAPYQARIDGVQAGAHDMAPFRPIEELRAMASVDLKFVR